MRLSKSLCVLAGISACASTASAAIVPFWRVNPITPAALAASPQLANAISVSLMVELTGGSLFNVAGLDLSGIPLLSGVQYYNHFLGADTIPTNALFPIFPDLEFDSYVATTAAYSQQPSIPGRLNGTGAAQVGTDGQYNVAWGATPNTGGTGSIEIARVTMLGFFPQISIPIPITNGLVADGLNPNVNVPLPPLPLPEPMSFAIAGLGVLALRRK